MFAESFSGVHKPLTKVQKKKNETDSAIVPTKMWLSFQ
jgi:hypothetical protein